MKMQQLKVISILLLLLLFLQYFTSTPFSSSSSPPPIDSSIYCSCSQLKYELGSSYQSNINTLLTSILTSSVSSPFNNFTFYGQDSSSSTPLLYGLYQCRGDVSTSDCYRCIQAAVSQIGVICSDACGGAVQLQGCFVKYDNASFLGDPDKTMVASKCDPMTTTALSGGSDLLSLRNEVLTELANGSGSFRVSTVGYVSGMAQCVGDLSPAECGDCVRDAIEHFRVGCGSSVSGAVYLVKCYVRCTEPGGLEMGDTEKIPQIGDKAGKTSTTWTIIFAVLAAIALIVVLLFLSRWVSKGDEQQGETDHEQKTDKAMQALLRIITWQVLYDIFTRLLSAKDQPRELSKDAQKIELQRRGN